MEPNYQPTQSSPQPPIILGVPEAPRPQTPTPPPVTPPTQTKMQGDEHNKTMKILSFTLVILIVLGGAYYVFSNFSKTSTPSFSNERVTVGKSTGLPTGFPTFIPVEVPATTDSSTLVYPDRGVTLYSLAIRTSQQPEDLFILYSNAIKKAGMVITKSNRNTAQSSLEATLGGNGLSIMIVPQSVGAIVQIAYSEQK